jgi:dTDP-4-dehydrorhamnose reductase
MARPALVLGGTGMIGHGVVASLLERGLDVRATTRHPELVPEHEASLFEEFEVAAGDLARLVVGYGSGDFVVNCLGLIKQYIRDDDLGDRRRAIAVNADFPQALAEFASGQGFRIIHVTTDCVFSGRRGSYVETDLHDAPDVYGRSKSLGEVPGPGIVNLRCSVIGQEVRGFRSLLHWVLGHDSGETFHGYTDHKWNGITATALGRIVAGIMATANPIFGTVHVVPADSVNKYELTRMILEAYGRRDVSVLPTETGTPVNRVLSTVDPVVNARLWADAGYGAVPSIEQLVQELPTSTQPYRGKP